MISRQDAAAHPSAEIDTDELLLLLKNAFHQLRAWKPMQTFRRPLAVAVRDRNGLLREFQVDVAENILPTQPDDAGGLFVLPLTLIIIDKNNRIARQVINAREIISAPEFMN